METEDKIFAAGRGAAGSPRPVPFRIENPQLVPAQRYHDAGFYQAEVDHLWPHVWQMACRLEEIPEVGDWVEYSNVGRSVIVVRTQGGIKAFHNHCRHRGVSLVGGAGSVQGNCAKSGFICPFHGWRWNLDGENTFVYGRNLFDEALLRPEDLNLVPCRVEIWGGSAFINFNDDAPGLVESLGSVTEKLDARNIADLKVEWWRSAVLPVNWKLAMEAFMESYHLMRTHPQLFVFSTKGASLLGPEEDDQNGGKEFSAADFVDHTIQHLAKLNEGMAGMVHGSEVAIAESLRGMELPNDPAGAAKGFYTRLRQEITDRGRAQGIPVPDLNAIAVSHPVKAVEYLFPHFFLLPVFSAMSAYRVRPLGPESCLFEIWSLFLCPEDEKRERPMPPVPLPHDDPSFPEVPRQDYANLPLQQRGLHSQGFDFMRLSRDMEGLISNYQRLIDGYLAGEEPEKLAHGTRIVCQGLDVPVQDIGF